MANQEAKGTWHLVPLEEDWWNFENETEEIAFGIYGGTPEQRKRYLDYLNERESYYNKVKALKEREAALREELAEANRIVSSCAADYEMWGSAEELCKERDALREDADALAKQLDGLVVRLEVSYPYIATGNARTALANHAALSAGEK